MSKEYPLPVFRFRVDFYISTPGSDRHGDSTPWCSGAFSECSGLEATMETKAIKEGGKNYGQVQRAGRVSFATVILKRGITKNHDLWKWFELVANGAYAYRLDAKVRMFSFKNDPQTESGVIIWSMQNALPTKFKFADLNAKSTDVGIEELHFIHEGLSLELSSGESS